MSATKTNWASLLLLCCVRNRIVKLFRRICVECQEWQILQYVSEAYIYSARCCRSHCCCVAYTHTHTRSCYVFYSVRSARTFFLSRCRPSLSPPPPLASPNFRFRLGIFLISFHFTRPFTATDSTAVAVFFFLCFSCCSYLPNAFTHTHHTLVHYIRNIFVEYVSGVCACIRHNPSSQSNSYTCFDVSHTESCCYT